MRLYSPGSGIKGDLQLRPHVVRKKFSQPIEFDRGGTGNNRIHFTRASAEFSNLRCHDERTLSHHAFPRQRASPAMHQFAPPCVLINPPHAIAETNEYALLQGLIADLALLDVETFLAGDLPELGVQRPDLSRRDTMNAELAQSIHPELIPHRVIPRFDQNPEVGRILVAEQVVARRRNIFARIPQKQVASLSQSRHETRLINAPIFLRREQHARVARMYRERE